MEDNLIFDKLYRFLDLQYKETEVPIHNNISTFHIIHKQGRVPTRVHKPNIPKVDVLHEDNLMCIRDDMPIRDEMP